MFIILATVLKFLVDNIMKKNDTKITRILTIVGDGFSVVESQRSDRRILVIRVVVERSWWISLAIGRVNAVRNKSFKLESVNGPAK